MTNFWELSDKIGIPEELKLKKQGKSKYPFSTMAIGDSAFFDGKTTIGKECTYAYNYGRKSNKKFAGRSENCGVRIWRIE